MPGATWHELAERLIAEGLAGATPAVAVVNATRPDELRLHGSVADLAQRLAAHRWSGPLLILYGAAFAPSGTESVDAALAAAPAV